MVSVHGDGAMARAYTLGRSWTTALDGLQTELTENDYNPLDPLSEIPSFDFNALSKSFVEDYIFCHPSIAKELRPILKSGNTFDIVKTLWYMDTAHMFLNPDELIPNETRKKKDVVKALEYLKCGEQCYKKNKEHALKFFNAAITFVPHPGFKVGGRSFASNFDPGAAGMTDCEALKVFNRVMTVRASALYEMKQYSECLKDLEYLAFRGCFNDVKDITLSLGDACRNMMSEPNDKEEENVSFSSSSELSQQLFGENECLSDASEALDLVYVGKENRWRLITKRDVKFGEKIIVERSYCNTVLPKYKRVFCMRCLRRTPTPYPCPGCTQVVFCSLECQAEALLGFHWSECPILDVINALNIDVRGVLACRILFKTTFEKLEAMYERIVAEQNKPLDIRGLNEHGAFNSEDYISVFSMTSKKWHSRVETMQRAVEAFVLLRLMISCGRFFGWGDSMNYYPSPEDMLFIGSLLLHHLINLWGTVDGYYETNIIGNNVLKNPVMVVAAGVFPVLNMTMAKDRYAPFATFTHGALQVMRATCAVPAGTVVTCNYTPVLWEGMRRGMDGHRIQLLFGYHEMPPLDDMPPEDFHLICERCSGEVSSEGECSNCGHDYHKILELLDKPGTYEFGEKLKSNANRVIDHYKDVRNKVLTKGECGLDDMGIIYKMIRFFDKHVWKPSDMQRDAMMLYVTLLNHKVSSVKDDGLMQKGCTVS